MSKLVFFMGVPCCIAGIVVSYLHRNLEAAMWALVCTAVFLSYGGVLQYLENNDD